MSQVESRLGREIETRERVGETGRVGWYVGFEGVAQCKGASWRTKVFKWKRKRRKRTRTAKECGWCSRENNSVDNKKGGKKSDGGMDASGLGGSPEVNNN